jgi:uncharacterized membrane protein
MDKKLITLLMTIILFYSLIINVSFANLYVKPAKLGIVRVEIFSFTPAVVNKNFTVGNFYNFPIDIVLQPTGNISDLIKTNMPTSFTLQSNETKNIEYTLTISKEGTYTGGILISVKGQNITSSIAYQADLTVFANKGKTQPELYIIITVIVIAFLIIVYLKSMRSRK